MDHYLSLRNLYLPQNGTLYSVSNVSKLTGNRFVSESRHQLRDFYPGNRYSEHIFQIGVASAAAAKSANLFHITPRKQIEVSSIFIILEPLFQYAHYRYARRAVKRSLNLIFYWGIVLGAYVEQLKWENGRLDYTLKPLAIQRGTPFAWSLAPSISFPFAETLKSANKDLRKRLWGSSRGYQFDYTVSATMSISIRLIASFHTQKYLLHRRKVVVKTGFYSQKS